MGSPTTPVIVEIPADIASITRMNAEELKQELAFALFARGKLSFGKARELAGFTIWDFQNELGRRGLALHYGVEELAEDVASLRDSDK